MNRRAAISLCHGVLRPSKCRAPLRAAAFSLRLASSRVASASPASQAPAPPTRSWVDSLPRRVQPYALLARIDKPIGTLLLFYPCGWAIAMSSYAVHAPPSLFLGTTALFAAGALVMRGAGCTINDMWDRRLDARVERTKNRPLARGDLSVPQTVAFLGAQLSVGLAVLLQLNWYSIALGASSLAIVVIYPFMKRVTNWPQFVLGLAFNWGALLGWSAVAGTLDWSVSLPLYAGGVCWTLVYDTVYAHQDKVDDQTVGVRSTALLFGAQTRPVLTGMAVSSLSLISLAGFANGQTVPFYVGVGLAAVQLARVLRHTDFDDTKSCWKGFVGCGWAGFWIWMGAGVDFALLALQLAPA